MTAAAYHFLFSSRRRHTRSYGDWSSDVCSSDLGAVVAVVAILQSLDVGGVTRLVATYFSGDDPLGPGTGRGTSTLDSSIGVGDVVAIDLAICGAWLLRRVPGRRGVLAGLALLFAFGGLASGQFSGLIALAVSVLTLAVVTGHVRRLLL